MIAARMWATAGALLAISCSLSAQEDIKVIVAPFENNSTARAPFKYEVRTNADAPKRALTIDRYTEAPRAVLEDIFVSFPGISVLERNRVDAVLLESDFGAFTESMDSGSAVRLGKMLGANAVIIGTINDIRTDTKTFDGYGVTSTRNQVSVSLRIRMIDVESGTIRLSQLFRGSMEFGSDFKGTADSDSAYSIIEGTLESLRTDKEFQASLRRVLSPDRANHVEVAFQPQPENCDIEVDGIFVGTAPLEYMGPRDQLIEVRISKPGYESWVKSMRLKEGMRIAPELVKSFPSK